MAKLEPKSGYLLLFDIRDSTSRKQQYKKTWPKHVAKLCRQAAALAKQLAAQLGGKAFSKSIGDAVMVFVDSVTDDPNKSAMVLASMAEFKRMIEEMPSLEGLQLKVVGSLIEHDVLGNGGDVLGLPVDFVFRMEKFADITHLVICDAFYNSLGRPEVLLGLRFKVTKRLMKGWKEAQPIVLAVSVTDLADMVKAMQPDPAAGDVLLELFALYLEEMEGSS